jgi:charged multivesicular body protein 4
MFGAGGKDKGMPTTGQAIQKLRETEEMLIKKQEFLEKKIDQELDIAKKNGTKNKRGLLLQNISYFFLLNLYVFTVAIQALKRKKRYEKQLQQIDGTISTIEMQREALEGANTNTAVLQTMGDAAKALKAAHQHM